MNRQFSRGQVVNVQEIQDRTVFVCIQVVGGSPCNRYVIINSTSIFSLQPTTPDGTLLDSIPASSQSTLPPSTTPPTAMHGTLLSQRSLLEIGRVTFLKTQSFTVHYKTSYGGDQVEYKYNAPLDVVDAIRSSLDKLGVKGKHTKNSGAPTSPPQRRRIQGGSFHERPRDAIKRLEGEMKVRPTLTIVRAIMDRYRRLIDSHVMNPSAASQKEAERLMHAQHKFLMREDVTKTLNSESQILKQREKRSNDDAIERERSRNRSQEDLDVVKESVNRTEGNDNREHGERVEEEREKEEKQYRNDDSGGHDDRNNEEGQRKNVFEKKVICNGTNNANGSIPASMESFKVGTECYTVMGKGTVREIRADDSFKVELCWVLAYDCKVTLFTTLDKLSLSKKSMKSVPGSHDRGDSIDGTIITRSNSKEEDGKWSEGLSEEDAELDDMMSGFTKKGSDDVAEELDCTFVGVPYRRQAGEVYYCHYDTPSQIKHARVAEQGIFLGSGRHQTLFLAEKQDEK
jgi:hypothetical protein